MDAEQIACVEAQDVVLVEEAEGIGFARLGGVDCVREHLGHPHRTLGRGRDQLIVASRPEPVDHCSERGAWVRNASGGLAGVGSMPDDQMAG